LHAFAYKHPLTGLHQTWYSGFLSRRRNQPKQLCAFTSWLKTLCRSSST